MENSQVKTYITFNLNSEIANQQLDDCLNKLGKVRSKYVKWQDRMGNKKTNTHVGIPFTLTDQELTIVKLSVAHPAPVRLISVEQ
jgi:hypothetical protein